VAALTDAQQLRFRALGPADRADALAVINRAALWYREFLPPEEIHDPEMTPRQWDAEGARMTWYGAFQDGALVGVMGLESIGEAALIRHGYVLPAYQRQGIGGALLAHLERECRAARIIVGTYAANYMARSSLEKAGYVLSADSQAVLRDYFAIPPERALASVTYEKRRTA
jgi:GNAT superfamily N-acetyltransferase